MKNAIEACEDGQGSVNVSTSQDKKGFYIKVADTGVRIPAEDIPKLSQPFHVERSERDGARARIQLQSGRGTPRVGSRGEHTRSGVRVHGLLSPRGGRGDAPPSSKKTPSGSCCPTSARLPQRPTPIYTSAISSTFGSKLEALITSNSTEAATVLGILKADSLGIASFTVADMIPNEKQTPPNPPAHPSLMGRASELFEVDKKRLEGVFRLLTITLIASDLAGAIEIWKAVPGSFNVVTIDGDTIDRSGFITGGSEKAGTGIVSRRRIIEELEEKVTDLNIIKDTAKNTKNTKVGSKQSLEAELGNCQADVRKLELEIVGINNKISNIDLASSRDEENIRSLDTEQSHMIDTKDQLRLELDGLTEVVTAYKKERIRIEASNVSSQKSIDQAVIADFSSNLSFLESSLISSSV